LSGQALAAALGAASKPSPVPLTYGKPGFKNDGFLAWGRRA
jgi:hypothetical protein